MKTKALKPMILLLLLIAQKCFALSSGDVSVRLISGYFWLDNSCTSGSPLGKVVSFRIKNTKGSPLQGVKITLGTIGFTATGGTSYVSGTPSFLCKTPSTIYLGNIATGDSATAFFFVGYNCLMYPNNTNITTDYITLPVTIQDINPGTITCSFNKTIYVIRNANNNTITVLATTANLVGTMLTISVAYNISNVKPSNIIDMELSTTSSFPSGYSILGCKITSSSISDFPVNMLNTHYSNSISANLPSGGNVTIEWYLKITGASTGITSSNIIPYVVSDAGSAQRWQANTTSFTGTSTPTNSLSISKKVNIVDVLANDTVRYTIVLKNNSSLASISIDQLVDNLPRDYKFLYMETDTNTYKKLITYSNCTSYPDYQDTNYLDFYGQKETSPGIFSWVIPKNDSIKLIYSTKVSAIPGINDTNFISAYVGSSIVGTAFAKVNVYSPLSLGISHFEIGRTTNNVELIWLTTADNNFDHFNIYRQSSNDENFIKIGEVGSNRNSQIINYQFSDLNALEINSTFFTYKIEQIANNNIVHESLATIDLTKKIKDFSIVIFNENDFGICNINEGEKSIHVVINDVTGKILYEGISERQGTIFMIPYNIRTEKNQCVFINIIRGSSVQSKKIVIE